MGWDGMPCHGMRRDATERQHAYHVACGMYNVSCMYHAACIVHPGVYISSRRELDIDLMPDEHADASDDDTPSHATITHVITSPDIVTPIDVMVEVHATDVDDMSSTPDIDTPKRMLTHTQSEASLLHPVLIASVPSTPVRVAPLARHTRSASFASRTSRVQSEPRTRRSTAGGDAAYRWHATPRHRHVAMFGLGIG